MTDQRIEPATIERGEGYLTELQAHAGTYERYGYDYIQVIFHRPEIIKGLVKLIDAHAARQKNTMTEALERIANDWGHCETCGTPCKGATECDCARPTWAPDDVQAIARAALPPDPAIRELQLDELETRAPK